MLASAREVLVAVGTTGFTAHLRMTKHSPLLKSVTQILVAFI